MKNNYQRPLLINLTLFITPLKDGSGLTRLFLKNKNRISKILISLVCLFLVFFITGCAPKQWGDPLGEVQEKSMRQLLVDEQEKKNNCSCCLDAELILTWASQLYSGSLNGYIQVFLPSSVKMVALNPLGQPLFAFATDGTKFQAINAVKGVYKYGRLATFTRRFGIPDHVLNGEWGQWLTGNITYTEDQLTELHQDISSRGVWLTIEKKEGLGTTREYILYDPTRKLLLQRIILDQDGHKVANIDYTAWQNQKVCPLPTSLQVSGISFGVTINIEMKDILTDQAFSEDTFFLKLPEGYLQQRYP